MDNVAFIALGSNVGDRLQALRGGLERIARLPNTNLTTTSQAYESEAWGVGDQPDFANAVARVHTELPADQLLGYLLDIEAEMGRPPAQDRAAAPKEPRVIDLDLLLFDAEEWCSEQLTLPHPSMREREFVMRPLSEIGPDATWPDGTPLTDGDVRAATGGRILRALGPIPGFESLTVTPEHGGWAVLASGPGYRHQPALDLIFAATVLRDNAVPYSWDPGPPSEIYNPWGFPATVRLMVPKAYLETASQLVSEAVGAPIDWDELGREP